MLQAIAAAATSLGPELSQAQWRFDAEAARVYDDNVSRAQRASDIVADWALLGHASLARVLAVGAADVSLKGEARVARYDSYSGLDPDALGVGASFRTKLGLGLTAPWLAADASLWEERYRLAVRNGRRLDAAATLGTRLDERFEGWLGASYDRRDQRGDFPSSALPGRPFSLQGRSVFARASAALGERALLIVGTGLRKGDVVSSTRRNLQIFRESVSIARDEAFGPDYFAYSLSGARTTSYSVALSWALGPPASVEASLSTDRTRARGGLEYEANVFALSLVYRR